jgi:SNF2 family DNA or RNA helicase
MNFIVNYSNKNMLNFFVNFFLLFIIEMKNNESDVAKNFREFSTKVRIGLSGTIIQNETIELWSLVDWY